MVAIRNIFVAGVALCCSSALRVDEDPATTTTTPSQEAADQAKQAEQAAAGSGSGSGAGSVATEAEDEDVQPEVLADSASKYKKMVALEKQRIQDNVEKGKSSMRALSAKEKLEGYEAVRAKLSAAAGVATKDLEAMKSRAADYENKAKDAHSAYCNARKNVITVNKHLEDLATKSEEASQHVKDTEVSIGKAESFASASNGHLEVAKREVEMATDQTEMLKEDHNDAELAADEAKNVEQHTNQFWDEKINTKAQVDSAREVYEKNSMKVAETTGDEHAAQIEVFEANQKAAEKKYELKALEIAQEMEAREAAKAE